MKHSEDQQQVEPPQITSGMKFVIFFSGLRGAVAFSCSNIFPNTSGHREVIICTTTSIILITTFIQGMLIIPAINIAKVNIGVSDINDSSEKVIKSPPHIEKRFIYPMVIKNRSPLPALYFHDACASPDSIYRGASDGESSGGGYPSDSDDDIDENSGKMISLYGLSLVVIVAFLFSASKVISADRSKVYEQCTIRRSTSFSNFSILVTQNRYRRLCRAK